jgi:hypothetical protein
MQTVRAPREEVGDPLAEQFQLCHLVAERPEEDPSRAGIHEGGEPLGAHLGGADQ